MFRVWSLTETLDSGIKVPFLGATGGLMQRIQTLRIHFTKRKNQAPTIDKIRPLKVYVVFDGIRSLQTLTRHNGTICPMCPGPPLGFSGFRGCSGWPRLDKKPRAGPPVTTPRRRIGVTGKEPASV